MAEALGSPHRPSGVPAYHFSSIGELCQNLFLIFSDFKDANIIYLIKNCKSADRTEAHEKIILEKVSLLKSRNLEKKKKKNKLPNPEFGEISISFHTKKSRSLFCIIQSLYRHNILLFPYCPIYLYEKLYQAVMLSKLLELLSFQLNRLQRS